MGGAHRTRIFPSDYGSPGWWALLPAPPPARKLEHDGEAGAVVVGAGFTGLAIARRLAELRPDDRIVVLEAQRPGYGSSGRNSGFLVDMDHWMPGRGVEGNARVARLFRSGIRQLERLVVEHDLDCDWSAVGRLHVAVDALGRRRLEELRRGLELLKEPFEDVPREAIRERIGTDYYSAAVHTSRAVLVQPAALARGLAGCLPENVELYDESPVKGLEVGPPHRVECEGGSVSSKELFLATNGFTPQLGFARRRVVPLMTFASLTRPLAESERGHAGGGEWGIVPEERMGSTVRRTRDHRILMRSSILFRPGFDLDEADLRRIAAGHREAIDRRFPDLRGVEIEHTWGGVLGNTLNDGQIFGRLGEGVYGSMAYNGVGVAMGTAAGSALADLAAGRAGEDADDLAKLPRPTWVPGAPWLGLGVGAYLAWLRWRAREEL